MTSGAIPAVLTVCGAAALAMMMGGCGAAAGPRCGLWVDAVRGEPVAYDALVADLATADVVYLGERHTIDRHHRIQAEIIDALGLAGKGLVIAFEQVEARHQGWLDRYADGEITFEQLAEGIDWAGSWSNYADYRPLLEAGRKHGARFAALNAPAETIRQVGRSGLAGLDAETRAQLPDTIDTDDPAYTEHLKRVMGVMAVAMPHRMDSMVEAQIARDEMMAESLHRFLVRPECQGRMAVVICGNGHVNYSFGTAQRVCRRMPQIEDRIVILSASGDVTLSPAMRKMARDMEITHAQLRTIPTRIGDYIHVVELKPNGDARASDADRRADKELACGR
jgi:uncharacterized iron-regulated protein